jgi:phospholipid transport system substrate-binding protein
MNLTLRTLRLSACLLAGAAALPSFAASDPATNKPINVTIQAVKIAKDDLALKQFAPEAQGKFLMGDDWAKGTDAQRKEFTQLFQSLFKKVAFPKIRENLKNLDAVNPGDAKIDGDNATVETLLVIDHPLKKQELKLKFSEVKEAGAW